MSDLPAGRIRPAPEVPLPRRGFMRRVAALTGGAAAALAGARAAAADTRRRRRPPRRPAVEPLARRADPRFAVRRAVEVRSERAAPAESRAHAHAALVGRVHAAAEPVRDHHAVGPALRAASRGRPRHRPASAPADDPRPRPRAARVHDGGHHALSVGVAHPLHRVRRQHRHGMGQRRGPDRPVHARHAGLQRVDRRAARDAARRRRASTGRPPASCSPRAPTARR